MAINYASKHAAQIDERFSAGSVTESIINKDYDFTGTKTVVVHSVPTVPMNDYVREGANRYGTPSELQDAIQELTMTQDKSFTFTVDKGNSEDDAALNAGKGLSRQLDQVIIPMVDRYRLTVMSGGAGHRAYGAPTKTTAYEKILDINQMLDDDAVPTQGRVLMVSGTFYKMLKLDSSFVRNSELGQKALITGQIGEVDGLPVVKDMGRLPKGVSFGIFHPMATTAPHKLSEYKIHIDPPGISGALVEGRDYYDAFVLDNKRCALGVHFGALLNVAVANTAGASGKTKFTLKDKGLLKMGTLVYLLSESPVAPSLGDDISETSTYPELTLDADIAATSGNKYIVLLKDRGGKCIGSSGAATAAAVGE